MVVHPTPITISVYGEAKTGKKTLVSSMDGCIYTRAEDKQAFVFNVHLGASSDSTFHGTSAVFVLVDATKPFELSSLTVQRASTPAAPVYLLFTKIDLLPGDYSSDHLRYLRSMRLLAFQYDIDCISASLVTMQGINDLVTHAVNKLVPIPQPRRFDLGAVLWRINCYILDFVATCFALPSKQTMPNVDEELATISDDDDILRLQQGATSTEWNGSLKHRVGIESHGGVSTNRITPSLIVKSKAFSSSEYASMEYVRQHTSIPVPRLHLPHLSWLIMDFIEGDMLIEIWDGLSYFMQFRIACTLRLYVKQMRSLKGPAVGGVENQIVTGAFFEFNEYGPFDTPTRLRRFCDLVSFTGWESTVLVNQYIGEPPPPLPRSRADWSPVFTHGDLNVTNILLDKQGTLWLLDWDAAGFYPGCIESLSMMRLNKFHDFSASWERYRWFISGVVAEEEEKYWSNIEGAIHRFPPTST